MQKSCVIQGMNDDINEFQKEWRALIINSLTELKSDISALRKDIAEIKGNFVPWTEFSELRKDMEDLKLSKSKFIGVVVGINLAAALIGWGIQTFLYWHSH